MEGAKSDYWIDARRDMFGSEVEEIKLQKDIIIFIGPTFVMPEKQKKICKLLNINSDIIYGVDFIKKKKQTDNWFEKLFSSKEEWIRIYY